VGWSNNSVFQVLIVTGGTGSGVFVYSPSPGLGNLIASIAAGVGNDIYGNRYLNGVTSYTGGTPDLAVSLQNGILALYSSVAGPGGPWSLDANLQESGPGGFVFLQNQTAGQNLGLQAGAGAGVSITPSALTLAVLDTQTGGTPILDVTNLGSAIAPILRITAAAINDLFLGLRVTGDTNARIIADTNAAGAPRLRLGSGAAAPDTVLSRPNANQLQLTTADLDIATAGRGLQIKEGTNARMGTAVLGGGTGQALVSNTSVTANTRIFLTTLTPGGTPGFLRVGGISAGSSFSIISSNTADTSTVAWLLVEPG
jgi:hypothetical protein